MTPFLSGDCEGSDRIRRHVLRITFAILAAYLAAEFVVPARAQTSEDRAARTVLMLRFQTMRMSVLVRPVADLESR